MADVSIVPDVSLPLNTVVTTPSPVEAFVVGKRQISVLPPSGTYAEGGPTHGQLFPVGTR